MQTIFNDHKIRIFDKDGQELQSDQINWNSLDAVNYKFRQDPGGDLNCLASCESISTIPMASICTTRRKRGFFGDDDRFVSSGCIRVQNVRDYVTWLLKDTPGWDRAHIDEAIRSGERVDAKLATQVPVYWVYITAWATPEVSQSSARIFISVTALRRLQPTRRRRRCHKCSRGRKPVRSVSAAPGLNPCETTNNFGSASRLHRARPDQMDSFDR